jgi:hypothetical protein
MSADRYGYVYNDYINGVEYTVNYKYGDMYEVREYDTGLSANYSAVAKGSYDFCSDYLTRLHRQFEENNLF